MGENGAGGGKNRTIGAERRVFGAETVVLGPRGAEMGENGAGEHSGSYERGGKSVFIREISNFSIRVRALLLAL